MLYREEAIVVLPLVPVTPTSLSDAEGLPKKLEAAIPNAFAESSVFTQTIFGSGFPGNTSHIIAEAPAFIAVPINS